MEQRHITPVTVMVGLLVVEGADEAAVHSVTGEAVGVGETAERTGGVLGEREPPAADPEPAVGRRVARVGTHRPPKLLVLGAWSVDVNAPIRAAPAREDLDSDVHVPGGLA